MKFKLFMRMLVSACMYTASTVSAQETVADWSNDFFQDGHRIATAPLQWESPQWQKATGLMVITGTLMATADQDIADFYNRHRHKEVNNAMQDIGDVLSPLTLAGYSAALWGVGQMVPNDELSRSGFKMGEAVVYSTLIAGGIKVMVGRTRPLTGADAHDFSGWSWRDDHQSFPSAHATAAFAVARVLSPQMTPLQRLGAYVAASLVAFSRVYLSDHWLSDVVFGAGLGYSVGAVLADDTAKDQEKSGWWIMPTGSGLKLAWYKIW
jgi:membrane-associated phospholipid phosphatase